MIIIVMKKIVQIVEMVITVVEPGSAHDHAILTGFYWIPNSNICKGLISKPGYMTVWLQVLHLILQIEHAPIDLD